MAASIHSPDSSPKVWPLKSDQCLNNASVCRVQPKAYILLVEALFKNADRIITPSGTPSV